MDMDIDKLVKSWFLSALIYRIKDDGGIKEFQKLVWEELGMQSYFNAYEDGAQLCGVALDRKRHILYQVERGTGGFDFLAKIDSWYHNLTITTGYDAQHDGFQMLGNRSFDTWKHFIENAQETVICGHSQGSGVGHRLTWLCCRERENGHLNGLKHVDAYLYAVPPYGKQVFADDMNRYIKMGLAEIYRFQHPGDPIASAALRAMFDAVDVGDEIRLPEMIVQDLHLAEVVNHSCRIYSAALLLWAMNYQITADEMRILKRTFELTVN